MTANGWFQILLFFAIVALITKPLGRFMTRVFNRERTFLDPVLRPIERLLYKITWVDENREMNWKEYAVAMLLFSAVSMVVVYALQRLQAYLPFNPQKLAGVTPNAVAFNTAASFTTNTNWQNYGGETTMSYLTQMAGLAYHNFVSAATGIALVSLGDRRRPSAISGSILCVVVCGCCCRFALSALCFWYRKAWSRTSSHMTPPNWSSRCTSRRLLLTASRWSMPRANR
jgi:potassium-transporting ATPase A subunit